MGRIRLEQVIIVALIAMLTVLSGCSLRKNTAATRKYQAFITRYNIYYNGDEHYKETLKQMETNYEDDYSQLLFAHPADARRDESAPQPSGDFTRSIEKAQKAIQLRSIKKKPAKKAGKSSDPAYKAWMKRDEYNPFLHNAWMMMGRSQYNNGDFLGAAATFYYITRHFSWLPATVTEARIWQARSYLSMGWDFEAENILEKIPEKELEANSQLRNLYNLVQSAYWSRSANPSKAIPYLEQSARSAKGSQKSRLNFMLGQLYQREGQSRKAYEAYKRSSTASSPYRTQINARIRQSEVYSGSSIEPEVKALRRMTRYDRNKDYLDQIYYAIGNLYMSRGDTAEAKKNYSLAVEKSTRGGVDKAMAQIALGNLLFDEHDYVKAQPCYSEAVPLLPDNYPDYKKLKLRSDVLDELATYSGNVELQDSLLALSRMPEEEQLKVAERLAEEYARKKKEEEEAAKREAYLAEQASKGEINNAGGSTPPNFALNSDKSWYFYNAQTKAAGKTEFQRRWGARKLEDDWRRRNKNTFSFDEDTGDDEDEEGLTEANDSISEEDKKLLEVESDPANPKYYLKDIPRTEQEILTCNDIVQEGLYNMAVILKDKLEDYKEARRTFDELDTRYPDNIYRLDAYYNLYLMDVREHDEAGAERYRQRILADFPDSPYGQAMADPAYFDNLRRMDQVQEEMYDRAYGAYLDNDNARVHTLVREMEEKYPLSKILPKFVFIDALSYVTDNNEAKFKERLTHLLEKWPDTDLTPMASDMVKYLNAGRKLNSGGGNTRGMLWETRLTSAGEGQEGAPDGTPANFDLDPSKPQLLVLAFPLDSVHPNQLLFDVARHNFSSFVVRNFDLEQMNFGNVGLLVIKGFANMKELEHYRSVMARDGGLSLPGSVRPIMISVANFELLLREGRSFEEYFRYEEDAAIREKEKLENPDGDRVPEPVDGEGEEEPSAVPEHEAGSAGPTEEEVPATEVSPAEEE